MPGPREVGGKAWSPSGPPRLRRLVAVAGMWVLRRRGTRASRVPGRLPAPLGAGKGRVRARVKGRGRRGLRSKDRLEEMGRVGWMEDGGVGLAAVENAELEKTGWTCCCHPLTPRPRWGQHEEPLTRGNSPLELWIGSLPSRLHLGFAEAVRKLDKGKEGKSSLFPRKAPPEGPGLTRISRGWGFGCAEADRAASCCKGSVPPLCRVWPSRSLQSNGMRQTMKK